MHHSYSQFETPYLEAVAATYLDIGKPSISQTSYPPTPIPHFPFLVLPNSSLSTSSELHTPSQWLSAIHLSDPLPISSSKSPSTISSPSQSCHSPKSPITSAQQFVCSRSSSSSICARPSAFASRPLSRDAPSSEPTSFSCQYFLQLQHQSPLLCRSHPPLSAQHPNSNKF